MTLPSTRPIGPSAATTVDFWRLAAITLSAQLLAVRNQRALFVAVVIGAVALAVSLASLALLLDAAWALVIGAVYIAVLTISIVGAVLLYAAWRLLDPKRLVFLSSTRGASLDVRFTGSVMSFDNHGRLPGDSSAAALRAQVANWAGTLPHHIDVRAQNSRVADLYAKQFPELTPGAPDAFGRVQMSGQHIR